MCLNKTIGYKIVKIIMVTVMSVSNRVFLMFYCGRTENQPYLQRELVKQESEFFCVPCYNDMHA